MDWGLGHITRTIPIIELLIERGHEVITCGNKVSKEIYNSAFYNISHINIDGYEPYYSSSKNQGWAILKQLIKFIRIIKNERKVAFEIAKQHDIDIIISDNRYGFRCKLTKNIFITHQIQIITPKIIQPLIRVINKKLIKSFDLCWIPDVNEGKSLAGNLSNYHTQKTLRIGVLSRFKKATKQNTEFNYQFLGIISGPEPQRSLIEAKLIEEFRNCPMKCAIINGKTSQMIEKEKNIDFYNHLNTLDFYELIESSKTIICRSGYSSIMDLSILQKEVIFIPTPGQTEQEYLANYHKEFSNVDYFNQDKFKLEKIKTPIGKIKKAFSNKILLEKAFKKIEI